MNTTQIQYAMSVAKHLNFTKAAKENHISQPALSANILKLEEELGTPLFDRSTFPVKLTYAGELFMEQAGDLLTMHNNMLRKLRDVSDNQLGRINIGLVQSLMPYVLPPLINEFKSLYPNIILSGLVNTENEIKDSVISNALDFGIFSEFGKSRSISDSEVNVESLGKEELVLVTPHGTDLSRHMIPGLTNTVEIAALGEIPMILPTDNSFLMTIYEGLFEENHIEPRIITTFNDSISLFRMASSGMAAAIVPKIITYWVKPINEVDIYSITADTLYLNLKICYKKSSHLGEPERNLIG